MNPILRCYIIVASIFLMLGTPVWAQREGRERTPADARAEVVGGRDSAANDDARPVLPTDPSAWVGTMLIIVVAMFVCAAIVGPVVRAEMAHQTSHIPDEPAGGDHGHGHSADHGHGAHGH